MSEAALTDSTTATFLAGLDHAADFAGSSRKTMSPSASWAWSVMPMVTLPSASEPGSIRGKLGVLQIGLAYVHVHFSSDQRVTVADEYGFDDARLEAACRGFRR
jgi:hypothetical protein